jgi:hypothetical protein
LEKAELMAKKASKMPEPQTYEGLEIGSLQSFPASTWDDFSFGKTQKLANGTFKIGNKSAAVPLQDLIEMRRRDGQTRALLRLFTLPILSCLNESKWVAPDYAENGADEEVEFANQMFRLPPAAGGMSSSLDTIMRYTLLALLEGFSAFEEVRYIPEKGPLKGKITLRKLAHRDASTVSFRVDEHGGFAGITQTFQNLHGETETVDIEKDKCWFYTANAEENPFYGVSMFETAWYHYDIKTKLYFIAHVAAQFAAVPGRIGTYPAAAKNTAVRQQFDRALQQFAFNTSLSMPEGFSVAPFNANTNFNFLGLIDHHAHQQAKSVLMQFADSDNRMVLIDNGKADASADMYVKALESIMNQIAESWTNNLMPKFIDWNFGTDNYPVFKFGTLSDQAKDSIKEVFSTVVASSVLNCTPEFVRELEKKLTKRLGLDVNYEEIEKHEAEAARLAAEEAALQQEMQALSADGQGGAPGASGAPGDTAPTAPGVPPFSDAPIAASPGPASQSPAAALSAFDEKYSLDDVVTLAQELLNARPQDGILGLDDAIGVPSSSRTD